MSESTLVANCVKAMQDAVSIDVTVKHRIGIDKNESYDFVRDFIGEVAEAGCKTFIVHARNAILKGLSPRENREIPPLRYEVVYQLKKDFPELEILLNGGIETADEVGEHIKHVDGVMIGRAAYHYPYRMAEFDARFYDDPTTATTPADVVKAMMPYIEKQLSLYGSKGLKMHGITRHMLGLMTGLPGARRFRQILSDPTKLASGNPAVLLEALAAVRF